MKAVIQPLAWGLTLVSMLALASGVALDVVVDTAQVASHRQTHGLQAPTPDSSELNWATADATRLER